MDPRQLEKLKLDMNDIYEEFLNFKARGEKDWRDPLVFGYVIEMLSVTSPLEFIPRRSRSSKAKQIVKWCNEYFDMCYEKSSQSIKG